MKSVWSGSLSFGLVSIGLKLFPAVRAHSLGFTLLCDRCKNRIKYQRWCEHCDKEVSWDHVVKGIQTRKGEYVVMTKETIEELKPEKTDLISIVEFVDAYQIEPIYFDQHYYVIPVNAYKPYALLHRVLQDMHKVAVGTFVMRDKEHVCAIQAYQNGLLLSTLNYGYEIRPLDVVAELRGKVQTITQSEIRLAKKLVEQLSKKTFDISLFKDTFAQKLKRLMKQKAAGKKVVREKKVTVQPAKQQKPTLMKVLQESLEHARPR